MASGRMRFVAACIVCFLALAEIASCLSSPSKVQAPAARLKTLLSLQPGKCNLMPCCYDGLSARLISLHPGDFKVTFMTGFGTAASRGYPDLGLLSAGDVLDNAKSIAESLTQAASESGRDLLPCIADGDTGYGGPASVRRTILNMGHAGMAGVLIEDQAGSKRCGHVDGKDVIPFEDALEKIKAAVAARDEFKAITGTDGPLILARTDARGSMSFKSNDGLEEGIRRCQAFRDAGADITFLESPRNEQEMKAFCDRVEGPKLANLIEGGKVSKRLCLMRARLKSLLVV